MTEMIVTYRPMNRARSSDAVHGLLGAAPERIEKRKPTVTYSTDRTDKQGRSLPDGIELRFGDARPTAEVREKLKEFGFRFSSQQVMWYAKDNAKSREFIDSLELEEIDVDTNVYEKHSFWAKVRSIDEYNRLRGRVEFMVVSSPPVFYDGKNKLESRENAFALVKQGRLKFKKFWNKVVGEDGNEGGGEDEESLPDESEGEEDDDDEMPEGEGEDGEDDDWDEDGENGGGSMAEILQRAADSLQPQIDRKLFPAIANQNRTPRRQRIIDGMRAEGIQLELVQKVLNALASAWANGKIERYPNLKKVSRRGHVELLLQYRRYLAEDTLPATIQASVEHNREKLRQLQLFTKYDWFDAYRNIQEVLKEEAPAPDPERMLEREIAEMIDKVRFRDFPGFFPTPLAEAKLVAELAELQPSDAVFDPSAGIGSLLDAAKASLNGSSRVFQAAEIQSEFRSILMKKGHQIVGTDFLKMAVPEHNDDRYDKVLMNPPFENGQDIEHVTRALKFLKPEGRLVAIVSAASGSRSNNRDREFRKLLQDRGAWVGNPIPDAFKSSFNPTGVAVRIVVINEDGSKPLLHGSEIQGGLYWGSQGQGDPIAVNDEDDDLELLELEAEAELELLKMQVEELRRKEAVNGLGWIRKDKLEALRRRAWALMDAQDVMDFK